MSEYNIKYEDKTIKLFERCIELGYKPHFHMVHKTPRGYEIERLLIIEWLETLEIYMMFPRNKNFKYWKYWNVQINIESLEHASEIYLGDPHKSKPEAQYAAIEKAVEILEGKKDEME